MPGPNLLVILSDQLRRGALGCHGDPDAFTPNLDQLASDGVRCDGACSTYPVCVPYRFSLMTGQYAHSRQVPAIRWRMAPSERTLADEFNQAGYETHYVGKWHLHGGYGPAAMKTPVPREHQGRWTHWRGFELRNHYFDTCYFKDADPAPIPIAGYQTDGLFDVAMQSLDRRARTDQPFAMMLSVEAPHPPFQAPPELEQAWLSRSLHWPANFMVQTPNDHDPDASDWSRARHPEERAAVERDCRIYYAMLQNLDQNVGRLREFLRRRNLSDNTVIVFTSDHGELGGAHQLTEKQYPYEESVGVPLIIQGGKDTGIPSGRVLVEPSCTEDLFPTLLGLCGIRRRGEEPLPGVDLNRWIRGSQAAPDRQGVMLEFVAEIRPGILFSTRPWRGWRSRRYKYTVWGGGRAGMTPWQLFDLQNDPGELHNLIDDPRCRALAAQHHAWLRQRMAQTCDDANLAPAFGLPALNPWA